MTEPTFTVSDEVLEQFGEWTECAAFRFRKADEDGLVIFEVTDDLERITDPDAVDA